MSFVIFGHSPSTSLLHPLFAAFSFTHCLYRYARFVPLCKYYFLPVQAASESSATCAPAYRRRLQPIASSSSSRERGGAGAGAWRQVKACQRHELELCTLVRLSQTHTHTHTALCLSLSSSRLPANPLSESCLCLTCMQRLSVAPLAVALFFFFFFASTSFAPSPGFLLLLNGNEKTNKRKTHFFFALLLLTWRLCRAAQQLSLAVRQLGSNCLLHFFSVIFSSSPSSCPVRSARQEVEKIYAISIDIARD